MLGWVKYCLEPSESFFFFLHGLISVFLLLGRGAKHEKIVFTILDHPVQHKALFKRVQFTSPTVLWMLHSSEPNYPPLNIFKLHIPQISRYISNSLNSTVRKKKRRRRRRSIPISKKTKMHEQIFQWKGCRDGK